MGVKRNSIAKRVITMPLYRSLSYLIIAIAGWTLLILSSGTVQAEPSLFTDYKGVVAIDAGHGGRDAGARGSDGSTEKEICLAIARRLTDLLEPAYRVVLTRSSDYDVSLPERAAAANNQRTDLLISLHTAADFIHAATGMIIYYYQPPARKSEPPTPSASGANTPIAWQDLQLRHIPASRQLATRLRQTIEAVGGIPDIKVVPAPLAVLQGADMPAVLIEVGHLTNPADEKRLRNPEWQGGLARAIAKGVESFLSSK